MAVNQLKAGAALNYVILGLNAITGLLYTPYMLRMLGQSEFGIYSLAASVIAYLSMLDFGFGNAVIRYTAKYRANGKNEEQYELFGMFTKLYTIIGVLTMVVGIVLFFFLDTMFGETLTTSELSRTKIIVLLLVFNLAFSFPLSIYGAIITAYENFVFLRFMQIARIILNLVVMITLLQWGFKAIAMVVVTTIFNFVTLGINIYYFRKKLKLKIKFAPIKKQLLSEVAIYSFWIFLNAIMDRIYWSTGQFILGAVSGTVAIAIFSVAIHVETLYMSFSTAITGVFLPRVTAMVTKKGKEKEVSNLFIKTGRIQYCVLSFILSGFILFGQSFINIWAGPDYHDSYVIALIFMAPLTVPLIQNLGITILQARNQMKFRSLLYIIIALLSLIFQIPLAKYFGGVGCAWAISGSLIAGQIIILNIYYYKKQNLDILVFWKEILKMSVVPFILVLFSYLLIRNLVIDTIPKFLIAVLCFSVIYIPLFWNFSMNEYERNLVLNPLRRKKQS
ncbi:MAG: oligosaccharide flippase family protein [Muribaculaceae bacterium]|nr:oligosaccharide flippase family protein [Muribaculaceae bacterium]